MISALTEDALTQAAEILNVGGVVIIPTDTVYGIAAHPRHPGAVQRIYAVKGRPTGKPIALLAATVAAVERFGAFFPEAAKRLAETYWPGALTLVLPCEGGGYEGFRVPAHEAIRRLITLCGGVLRVTSANLSGAIPALDAAHALKDVGLEADMVLDGGVSPGGIASTVVKVDPEGVVTVLREGGVAIEERKT
ncbi:MAG: L-threonylcarbamoyladenylate synthase [Kiritimatiellaeota bacterium]|nr:L-threonylcarbamoyladenylate synthase [Kiritimatiellota bacterium]